MENNEEWKKSSYEGYEVSNCGRVRSISRTIFRSDGQTRIHKGKILKQSICRSGYFKIRVSLGSEEKMMIVHREVAKLFIENKENKPQVNHIDGDKLNNHYLNLEWVNNSENQIHAITSGLKKIRYGAAAIRIKRKLLVYKNGIFICELIGNKQMKEFGLDPRLVHRCIKGKSKTHLGYTFKEQLIERK